MNRPDSIESRSVPRRTVIAAAASAGFPIISGCYDDTDTGGDEPAKFRQPESEENEYREIRTDLEDILEEVNRFPISQNGEFVFDVQEFEANFDFENLSEETGTLQERLERIGPKSDEERDALRSIARIAELLIRVRLSTHQAIAAGLSYGDRLSRGEYAAATEAVQHGRKFLEEVVAIGREIENEIGDGLSDSVSVDGFEPDSIRDTQSVLLEIVQWGALIYRSFEYASIGFELFVNAAEKIEDERVEEARANFESAGVQFTNAKEVLERAHGQGQRLGYIVPLVQKLRCILPIYRDTSERFADSFTAWKTGEEDEARRIAREVIDGVDQQMAQCEASEAT